MAELIGNISQLIDWDSVILKLENTEPGYIGPRHKGSDDIIGIQEMAKLWDDAGFILIKDGGNAGWDMFFPKVHFDENIVTIFSEYVNVQPLSCWISRINPGCMTPWHWDCNDNEEYYETLNTARFTCQISKPTVGHAVMIEDHCLYFENQGTVYKWPSRKSWHGGINCGFKPKYLFNFFGIVK